MNEQDVIITTPSTSIVEPLLNKIPIISIDKISNMNGIHSYYEDMLRPFKDNTIMPNSFDDIIKLIKRDDLKNPEI